MKTSGIGGQAVIEGVMMRNKDHYAVAVRKESGEIVVKQDEYHSVIKSAFLKNTPFIRGFFAFIDSMVLGMSTLSFAADVYAQEEEAKDGTAQTAGEGKEEKKEEEKGFFSGIMMGATFVFSLVLALGIFVALPYFLSLLFQKFIASKTVIALIEGVIRIIIFVGYVSAISLMKDIRRVYMYHGTEHKCINCIEHGMPLTVENVRKSSKEHKRCGTSFLLFVVLISVVVGMLIRVDSVVLRLVIRLLLIPVIAGVAFELIRLAGRSEHPLVKIISRPGLWMQGLTTKEPDDDMIEVGIASVEAVFDWRSFIEEEFAS